MAYTKEDVFDRVYRSLYRTFSRGVKRSPEHPYWEHDFCRTFDDLDRYLTKKLGAGWIYEPWAKYWLGNHFLFERTLVRHEVLNKRGVKFRNKVPGSVRYNRKYFPKPRRIPEKDIAVFIQEYKNLGLRKLTKLVQEKYKINISHETLRSIKKKYNL